jgi:hypothetical protein
MWTVEKRPRGWYVKRTISTRIERWVHIGDKRLPMIARGLRIERTKRDRMTFTAALLGGFFALHNRPAAAIDASLMFTGAQSRCGTLVFAAASATTKTLEKKEAARKRPKSREETPKEGMRRAVVACPQ